MTASFRKVILRKALPAVAGGLFAALPLPPPAKLGILALLLWGMSALLLGLSGYELYWRLTRGAGMAALWLLAAAGLVCYGTASWLMSRTWGLPHSLLTFGRLAWSGGVGTLCMAGFLVALLLSMRQREVHPTNGLGTA